MVLILLPVLGQTQAIKPDCEAMLQKGDALMQQADPPLQDALKEYLNALNCNSKLAGEVGPKIQTVFKLIEEQKIQSDKNERLAVQRQQEAVQQRQEAEAARKEAEELALTARSAALAAKARQIYPEDNTIALNLAIAAYQLKPTAESKAAMNDIWSDPRSKFYKTFTGHTSFVLAVAFSPDGEHILTSSEDNTAKLWDLQGNVVQDFAGHTFSVYAVAFSPDGKHILTGSGSTAKLWDLEGHVVQDFAGHTLFVTSVAFSPDGKMILTGSYDNTARLWRNLFWELESGSLWDRIDKLSEEELAKYDIQLDKK